MQAIDFGGKFLLVRGVVLTSKHPRVHERNALVVFFSGVIGWDIHFLIQVLVIDDFSSEFDVVVCYQCVSFCIFTGTLFWKGT